VIFLGGIKNVSIQQWKISISNLDLDIVSENRAKMIYSFLPTSDEVRIINLIFQVKKLKSLSSSHCEKLRIAESFLLMVYFMIAKQKDHASSVPSAEARIYHI
jgi:hypothetical protein